MGLVCFAVRGGQWTQLLKAGSFRAPSSLKSSGQLSIYMASCTASNLKTHLVLTSGRRPLTERAETHQGDAKI